MYCDLQPDAGSVVLTLTKVYLQEKLVVPVVLVSWDVHPSASHPPHPPQRGILRLVTSGK